LNLFTFKQINSYSCDCGKTTIKNNNENFINIFKNRNQTEIFENLVNSLNNPETVELKCNFCSRQNQTKKTTYDFEDCSYIIIRINDYNYVNQSVVRYYTRITNFKCELIKIFNASFKLIATVNHTGSQDSGHFTCCRKASEGWIEISDDRAKELKFHPGNPDLKNVYFMVLKKLRIY
jgi:ubiquitin C-terminal hydrolase